MVSSVTSLLATLQFSHSNHVDPVRLARAQSIKFAAHWDAVMVDLDSGAVDADALFHQQFSSLNDDPEGAVAAVHQRFGPALTADDRAAVRAAVADRPRGRHGGHEHQWSSLGLDHATERARFARYQERFAVASEVQP